jgi:hypothetical protein
LRPPECEEDRTVASKRGLKKYPVNKLDWTQVKGQRYAFDDMMMSLHW